MGLKGYLLFLLIVITSNIMMMNTVTHAISRATVSRVNILTRPQAQARLQSTVAASETLSMQYLKKNFNDPGAYPVIGILGFALGLCGVSCFKQLFVSNQDVRRSFNARQSLFRE